MSISTPRSEIKRIADKINEVIEGLSDRAAMGAVNDAFYGPFRLNLDSKDDCYVQCVFELIAQKIDNGEKRYSGPESDTRVDRRADGGVIRMDMDAKWGADVLGPAEMAKRRGMFASKNAHKRDSFGTAEQWDAAATEYAKRTFRQDAAEAKIRLDDPTNVSNIKSREVSDATGVVTSLTAKPAPAFKSPSEAAKAASMARGRNAHKGASESEE